MSKSIGIAYQVMRRNRKAKGGDINEKLHPEHEPSQHMGSIMEMDPKEIAKSLRKHMAEGGSATPGPSPAGPILDPNKAKAFSKGFGGTKLYAEGGEIEDLGEGEMNSSFMDDDHLSQDMDPMTMDMEHGSNEIEAEDPDQQKNRLSKIMNMLRKKHYGYPEQD